MVALFIFKEMVIAKKVKYFILSLSVYAPLVGIACNDSWLDAKPDKSLVVPNKVADYQALLDNTTVYNNSILGVTEVASDDYIATYAAWQSGSVIERGMHVWNDDPFQGLPISEWNSPYQRILQNNIVLDGLDRIEQIDGGYKNVLGTALFYRAFDFYGLAQQFCKPFDNATAHTDLGIPLRLGSNVNEVSVRATVRETYERIIVDLKAARELLPLTPLYKTRPSIPATYAMLARVYLSIEDYENAGLYADSCLQLYDTLLDYNEVNTSLARPFPRFNNEVIFQWRLGVYTIVTRSAVAPELYDTYDENDLRLRAFFNAQKVFKGSYDGSEYPFCGLATNEIYLIRAECLARGNDIDGSMSYLNTLLEKRWNNQVPYPTRIAEDVDDALTQVLLERRKELCFRGLRWSDLRRLNRDPRFAKTLMRELNGEVYTLPPNDLRYVFPIPDNEIVGTGIDQNPR